MVNPSKPQWNWNPSVITLLLVIVGIIASGAYYMGQLSSDFKSMQRAVTASEDKADKALKIALSDNPEGEPTPTPTPTPTPKRK